MTIIVFGCHGGPDYIERPSSLLRSIFLSSLSISWLLRRPQSQRKRKAPPAVMANCSPIHQDNQFLFACYIGRQDNFQSNQPTNVSNLKCQFYSYPRRPVSHPPPSHSTNIVTFTQQNISLISVNLFCLSPFMPDSFTWTESHPTRRPSWHSPPKRRNRHSKSSCRFTVCELCPVCQLYGRSNLP